MSSLLQDDIMEGIEPIKQDENDQVQSNATQYHHESTMMHHSTHSAFEAAAHMASTPFNPQFGSERPSFSPMSSIKAPMDGSLHRPAPTSGGLPTADSQHRSAPFSIAVDPVPTTVPMSCDSIPAQVTQVIEEMASIESATNVVGATRVEVTGLESFEVNETTVNPPSRLRCVQEDFRKFVLGCL